MMNSHDFATGWQHEVPLNPTTNGATRSPPAAPVPDRKGIVVFSGGSAANNLVDVFGEVQKANHATLSYVIPISDNGGSSSELIRVFGGPGMSMM